MRDDYQGAVAALQLLAKAISTVSADTRRLRANLVRVGRMLRDHALVRDAIVELRRREGPDDERFRAREQCLLEPASAAIRRLAGTLDRDGLVTEAALHATMPAMALAGRATAPVSFGDMLKEARNARLSDLTLDDLPLLGKAVDRLNIDLQAFIDGDPEISTVLEDVKTIQTACRQVDALRETRRLLGYLSMGRIADTLLAYASAWDAALQGEVFPAPPTTAIIYEEGIERDAIVLIDHITEQLELRIVRRFALVRLRLFFEQFEYERLRRDLAAAEKVRQGREAILQREMDRFLFQEGYFPLTHTAASRGYTDTALLDPIEKTGVPPLLIELKQVTAFQRPAESSRRAIITDIGVARGEVQRYRGALATRPQWSRVLPFIVVVHTCEEDVSDLEDDDVVLIDLSATTPSRKRARRERDPVSDVGAPSAPLPGEPERRG